jgi:hypothetical protein
VCVGGAGTDRIAIYRVSYLANTRSSFRGKAAGRETDRLPPSNIDVKNAWSYTTTSLYAIMAYTVSLRMLIGSYITWSQKVNLPHLSKAVHRTDFSRVCQTFFGWWICLKRNNMVGLCSVRPVVQLVCNICVWNQWRSRIFVVDRGE